MTARTQWLGALAVALLAMGGCERNRWGELCKSDDDCGTDLFCKKAGTEEAPAVHGTCAYPDGELRCGTGTVLEGTECVPDPGIHAPTCGPGTVEDNGRCVLATDAGVETDAGADQDAGPVPTCPTAAEACAGSDRCVAAQVLDMRTNLPVTPEDGLRVRINDPLTKPPTYIVDVPIGESGCFVARDLPVSSPVRLADITEQEDVPAVEVVSYSVNFVGDGSVDGVCCDYPLLVVRTEDEAAWSDALGLADGAGIEATGAWAGFIVGPTGPAAGAVLTNSGAPELRAQYFDDTLSGFLAGATETGASGGWVVLMTAPPFELGNFSATDPDSTAYITASAGTVPGQIAIAVVVPQ